MQICKCLFVLWNLFRLGAMSFISPERRGIYLFVRKAFIPFDRSLYITWLNNYVAWYKPYSWSVENRITSWIWNSLLYFSFSPLLNGILFMQYTIELKHLFKSHSYSMQAILWYLSVNEDLYSFWIHIKVIIFFAFKSLIKIK